MAVVFVALFFRYQYFSDVFTSKGFIASNTDTYYRLHRIEAMVNQPGAFQFSYPLQDQQLNFPKDQMVAWPLGLDLLFAAPLKWLDVKDSINIAFFSFALIPLLILPFMFLVFGLLRKQVGDWYALIGAGLTGISPALLGTTMLGNIDHHAIGALFILFDFYLLQRLKSTKSKKVMVMLAVIFGIAPSIDPHAWLIAFFVCASLLCEDDTNYISLVARSFLGAFAISLICLSMSDRFLQGYISISGFSWWASLIYAKIFLASLVLKHKKNPKVWAVVLGLFLLATLLLWSRIFGEVESGLRWLFASGTIGQTKESLGIYRYSPLAWKDFWLIFASLPIIGWFWYRKEHRALVLFSVLPILLSLFQIRFVVMAIPFAIILTVLFIHRLIMRIDQNRMRNFAWIIASFLIVWMMYPSLNFGNVRTKDYIHEYFIPVRDASRFLKKYTQENPIIQQDEFKPAVAASWDFGHWILYYSGLPVVSHPFQGETSDQINRLMLSEDEQTFNDFQKEHPARFLLIEQSIPRFFSLFEFTGKSTEGYYEKTANQVKEREKISNVFFNRYLFNLGADAQGNLPDHWRLLYASQTNAPDLKNYPAVKVFEHVKGAVVRLETTQSDLSLQIRLRVRDLIYQMLKKGQKVGPHTIEWTIPYGQIENGNVFCDGNFVILDSQHKMVKKLPRVTNEQVLKGETISVK